MARFLKQPQQQLVQMGSPIDVDFYSKILEKDQQNRDSAVGMQLDYIEKINNLPIYTEADRAATTGKIQNRLASMLDKSFITPTQMARTVMELNQEITPGIQALKAKDQAAQMYDKMRIQYGANALMGTDPRNIDITDETGRYRDPGSYKALGINLEDIDKRFLTSQGAELSRNKGISYIQGKGINVNGVPLGKIQIEEKKGLTPEEIKVMYAPGSSLARSEAELQLQTSPEILDIFNGDRDKATQFIMERNFQTAMVKGQESNFNLTTDETYQTPTEVLRNKILEAQLKDAQTSGQYDDVLNPFGSPGALPSTENPFNYATAEKLSEDYNSLVSNINWFSGTNLDSLPTEQEYIKLNNAYKTKQAARQGTSILNYKTGTLHKPEEFELATKDKYLKMKEAIETNRQEILKVLPEEYHDKYKDDKAVLEYLKEKDKIFSLETPKATPITGAAKAGFSQNLDLGTITSKGFRETGDLTIKGFDKIAKDNGYNNSIELFEIIKKETPRYVDDTGEFAYSIPVKKGNKVTTKVIYMDGIDDVTTNNSIMLKEARKLSSLNEDVKSPINIYTGNYEIDLQYTGKGKFSISVPIEDENGNKVKTLFKDLTFEHLSYVMKNSYIAKHLSENYAKPYIKNSQLTAAAKLAESELE